MPISEQTRMPFGKWQGERLVDIPDSYWDWLIQQPGIKWKSPGLYEWMKEHLRQVNLEAKQESEL